MSYRCFTVLSSSLSCHILFLQFSVACRWEEILIYFGYNWGRARTLSNVINWLLSVLNNCIRSRKGVDEMIYIDRISRIHRIFFFVFFFAPTMTSLSIRTNRHAVICFYFPSSQPVSWLIRFSSLFPCFYLVYGDDVVSLNRAVFCYRLLSMSSGRSKNMTYSGVLGPRSLSAFWIALGPLRYSSKGIRWLSTNSGVLTAHGRGVNCRVRYADKGRGKVMVWS